jgi:uncharacterized membrane protein
MNRFAILNNRKRAIIALVHSVFFLGVAGMQLAMSHAAAFSIHGEKRVSGSILLAIYVIVTTVLLVLLAFSRCSREKLYFALCAGSAGFGLVRILLGDPVLHANVLRVLLLGCAVVIGTVILYEHSAFRPPAWNSWMLAPLLLFAAALAVPYFLTHGFFTIGLALQRGFALVCHQRPERSFWMFGGSVAVCSRCLGIYLGAALGLLFRTSRTIALRLLIAAAALNLLDATSEWAGLHGNCLAVRFALGLALGITGAMMIASSVQRARPHPS